MKKEKTASMNESGVGADVGEFYNDKVSENLANKQRQNHIFHVGEIVRVKHDGIELPIERIEIDENDPKRFFYVVGGLYEDEDGIEKIPSSDTTQTSIVKPDFSLTDNPQPSPDDTTNEVMELPIWGLPPELQNVIVEVTNGFQCSRDYVVASMMVASSTMLGKRISCEFNNHTNFPSLWIAIIGRTASGKTAPLSWFFKPIEQREEEAFNEYRRELHKWGEDGNKGSKPEYRHMLINNPTDESVLKELSVNGSITWKTDELRTMFESWGKYSKNGSGGIVSNLLSIHSNEPISITRVTSEPIRIPKPNLNIIGTIQPPILKRVMAKRGYDEDGLFQRFLNVYPEETDIPKFTNFSISEHVQRAWGATIDRLAHMGEIALHETATAMQIHIDAIDRWRGECNVSYRKVEAMTSLLQKLEIHLCRWSIVVAILLDKQEITDKVMQYSIECMEYFKRCGEKVFCLIANDDTQPKEPTRGEIFKLLQKWYGDFNQSLMAEALDISQQAISKFLK